MPSEESLEVILVDVELSTREILEQFCRSRNLAVTVASDGRAAITAIERNPHRFTIILTDINMPGADGFEVLKTAKGANRESYVVMITGYATLDTALRAVREGAYDYLAKPFSLGQLDVMLAHIKDRIGLERENRDLRRRLQGVKGGAGTSPAPAQPTSYAPPSNVLRSAVLQPAPARQAPAAAAAAPAQTADMANRVGTMEERLARMEELLRAAITPR